MPYTVKTTGMEEVSRMLTELEQAAPGAASAGLYEGAGVMADAVSRAVHGIATEPFRYATGGRMRKPSPEEKAILEAAPKGVAKFNKNGTETDTSVGFARSGYAQLAGKTKPIPKIANAINSGTSFMQKQPFFRQAVSQNQQRAQNAIENEIRERLEKITSKI